MPSTPTATGTAPSAGTTPCRPRWRPRIAWGCRSTSRSGRAGRSRCRGSTSTARRRRRSSPTACRSCAAAPPSAARCPRPRPRPTRTGRSRTARPGRRHARPCPASSPPPRWHASSPPAPVRPIAVDLDSRVDLTRRVRGGRLDWTPPDDRTWVVTGSWYRGTAQRNDAPFGNLAYQTSDPEPRVVDHFGAEGAETFTRYFDTLLSPRTLGLLRRTNASLFEDSLELTYAQAWTPELLREFRRRNGYSLVPYLPLVTNDPPPGPFAPPVPVFSPAADDAAGAARVRRDFDDLLADLYLREHVRPLQRWAHGHEAEVPRAAVRGADRPRASGGGDRTSPNARRSPARPTIGGCWRPGPRWRGHRILSDEALPGGFGAAYGLTGPDLVRVANDQYALGANQLVWHGFPYIRWPDAADGTVVDDASRWPGFHGFAAFIPEALGPRQPAWTFEPDFGRYYARTQLALQAAGAGPTSRSSTRASTTSPAATRGRRSSRPDTPTGTSRRGRWPYPSARVERGRLAPEGPGFSKALIIHEQALPRCPCAPPGGSGVSRPRACGWSSWGSRRPRRPATRRRRPRRPGATPCSAGSSPSCWRSPRPARRRRVRRHRGAGGARSRAGRDVLGSGTPFRPPRPRRRAALLPAERVAGRRVGDGDAGRPAPERPVSLRRLDRVDRSGGGVHGRGRRHPHARAARAGRRQDHRAQARPVRRRARDADDGRRRPLPGRAAGPARGGSPAPTRRR